MVTSVPESYQLSFAEHILFADLCRAGALVYPHIAKLALMMAGSSVTAISRYGSLSLWGTLPATGVPCNFLH